MRARLVCCCRMTAVGVNFEQDRIVGLRVKQENVFKNVLFYFTRNRVQKSCNSVSEWSNVGLLTNCYCETENSGIFVHKSPLVVFLVVRRLIYTARNFAVSHVDKTLLQLLTLLKV